MSDIYARQLRLARQQASVMPTSAPEAQSFDSSDEFQANNIQLSNGEWVDKKSFYELNNEDQKRLMSLGTQGFNSYYAQKEIQFKSENVQLKTGEWINKTAYDSLSQENKDKINAIGIEKFNTEAQERQRIFEANNIKLNTGEYISKEAYDKLPIDWQRQISQRGVEGFNTWLETAYGGRKEYAIIEDMSGQHVYAIDSNTTTTGVGYDEAGNRIYIAGRWPSSVTKDDMGISSLSGRWPTEVSTFQPMTPQTHVKLSTGELINKTVFNELNPTQQQLLMKVGIQEFNRQAEEEEKVVLAQVKENYVEVKGELIEKNYYEQLSEAEKKEIQQVGTAKFIEQKQAKFEAENVKLDSGEYVSKADYESLPPKMQEAVKQYGLQSIQIQHLKPDAQFEMMKQWDLVEKDAVFAGVDEDGNVLVKSKADEQPKTWQEKYLTAEMAKDITVSMIPIAGTIYRWSAMKSPWEKGLNVGLDVLTLIPFVGGISTGVRAGGKLGAVVGRVALAELKAPITAITHLAGTAKAAIAPARTLLSPKRIPTAAAEIRSYILKFDAGVVGGSKNAMEARDALTKAAIMGNEPVIQAAGKQIKLAKVALNQKGFPVGIHTSNDIRAFLDGAIVEKNIENKGLFITSSMNTRLTGATAFGHGMTPAPDIGIFEWTGRKVKTIGKYSPSDIARLDKPPIRELNLADAKNIPQDIAPQLKAYIRSNDGTVVGSFSEWLKMRKASRPNDIDLNFANPIKARADIANIARRAGYKVQVKESAVLIGKGDKFQEIANVKGARQSFFKQHGIKDIPVAREIDGIRVIPLGEQYLRQGFGALSGLKTAKREKHMLKMATKIEQLAKDAGFTKKMPGALLIRDERVLSAMQPSQKLYRGKAEIEETIRAGTELPPVSQILKTFDPEGNTLYLGVIGKPYSAAEIAKFKLVGTADTIRDIFRPAMTIDGKAIKSMDELNEIAVEARNLERNIADARKAGNTAKVAELGADLARINSRAKALTRIIDTNYAGKFAIRAGMVSTGDFIGRLSYNEVARAKPTELARTLFDMPRAEQTRILNDITEKASRIRVEKELARLSTITRKFAVSEGKRISEAERETSRTGIPGISRGREIAQSDISEKERVKTPERTRVPPPPRVPPPIPRVSIKYKGKEVKLTSKQLEGAVAWKQGLFYKLWYPPYGQDDIINTLKPIPGVPYHKGLKSAYKSVRKLYGDIQPSQIKRDMGIVDVTVFREEVGRRQPKMRFTADVEGLTQEQMDGAIAWKQGLFYKLWYPPYGEKDMKSTTKPIAGVKYHEGIGSAAKSAIKLHGEIPKNIKRDMGIVDIEISRGDKGFGSKPKLSFKPDRGQKTEGAGIVKIRRK